MKSKQFDAKLDFDVESETTFEKNNKKFMGKPLKLDIKKK